MNTCEVFVVVVDEFTELDRQLRDLSFLHERGVQVSVLLNAPLAALPAELLVAFPAVRFLESDDFLPADENWQRSIEHVASEWFKIICVDDQVSQAGIEGELDLISTYPLENVSLVVGRRKVRFGRGEPGSKGLATKRPVRVSGAKLRGLQQLLAWNCLGEPLVLWMNARKFRMTTGFVYPVPAPGVPFLVDFHACQNMLAHGDVVFSRSEVGNFSVHPKSNSVRLGWGQLGQVRDYYRWLKQNDMVGIFGYFLAIASASVQVAIRVTLYRLKLNQAS